MNAALSQKIKNLSFLNTIFVMYVHAFNLYYFVSVFDPVARQQGIYDLVIRIEYFFSNGIFRVAVPFFFITSGYLFFLNTSSTRFLFVDKIKKRFHTLVRPYLLYSFLIVVISYMGIKWSLTQRFFQSTAEDIDNGWVLFNKFFVMALPIPYHLWFVKALIGLTFLHPVIKWMTQWKGSIILIVLFFLSIYAINHLFWHIHDDYVYYIICSVLCFQMGAYLAIFKINISYQPHWIVVLLLAVSWITILLSFYQTIALRLILQQLAILLGLLVIWWGYDYLPHFLVNTLKKLSIFNFLLYLWHEPLLTLLKKIAAGLQDRQGFVALGSYILTPIIITFVLFYVCLFLKKNLPVVYRLFSGNR